MDVMSILDSFIKPYHWVGNSKSEYDYQQHFESAIVATPVAASFLIEVQERKAFTQPTEPAPSCVVRQEPTGQHKMKGVEPFHFSYSIPTVFGQIEGSHLFKIVDQLSICNGNLLVGYF